MSDVTTKKKPDTDILIDDSLKAKPDEEEEDEGGPATVADAVDEQIREEMESDAELIQAMKEEEAEKKAKQEKFKNVTMQQILDAIELLEFYIDTTERAKEVVSKIKGPTQSKEEDVQSVLIKKLLGMK
jgi:regulator of protease activity HflC (stomatin/prohibitin superfamily)